LGTDAAEVGVLSVFLAGLLGCSAWLAAVSITCQFIHYPAFKLIPSSEFLAFHAQHTSVIGMIVGPALLGQVVCTFALLGLTDRVPWWAIALSFVFLAGSLGWTAFVSGPLHGQIYASGGDPVLIDRLIASGWVRNASWLGQAILAGLVPLWSGR
jgi:hypothetical protein